MDAKIYHVDNGRPYTPAADHTPTLFRGKVMTVFQDPFTRKRPEGVAILETRISRNHETGSEMWRVRFVHTGEVAVRRIHPVPDRRKVV